MSKATSTRPSPSAFPILMRLPDLRPKTGSRGAAASSSETDSPREQERSFEAPQAEPSKNAAEVQLRSPPQVEQPEQAAASSAAIAGAAASVATVMEEAATAVELTTASVPAQAVTTTAETAALSAGKEPSTEKEPSAEKEKPVEVAASPSDVTNASPADAADPVTPAAARRQRALERQRRQVAEPPRPRSWWTTHLPMIAIGFLVALVLTIYVGRRNRLHKPDDNQAAADLPEIEIDTCAGRDSLSPSSFEPGMLAMDKTDEGVPGGLDVSTKPKSPPLLSAKPKLTETEPPSRGEFTERESVPTAARPVNNGAEITNHFVTSRADGAPAAAELTADAAANYPSTEPAVYRPGGRAPREARTPNYPETSTPHLR